MFSCPSFHQPVPSFASLSLHTASRAETVPENPVVVAWFQLATLHGTCSQGTLEGLTVLKSPLIFGGVLEMSLNFCASPWKVLEFSSTLNAVAWKVFLMLLGCPKQIIKNSSEKMKHFCFLQELTSNWSQVNEKCREGGGANRLSLQSPIRMDWEWAFLYNLWNYIPDTCGWSLTVECGPWEVLGNNWLQFLCMKPDINSAGASLVVSCGVAL